MCDSVPIQLSPEDRARLERLVADRNTPQKHAWRARIVLLSGDGVGTMEIMRRTGQSKPTVWRWQARFAAEGVAGLRRDKTRPPGRKPLAASVIQQVVTKTTTETPPAATHWTARAMARAVGIAASSVQKVWQAHGLKPHLVRRFKLSKELSEIPCLGPYDAAEGAIVCRDANSPPSRMSCWTNSWADPILELPWPTAACWTG